MSRYIQQITVPEIGINGQSAIAAARVLIIGAGGLGTPAAAYLAAAGTGHIGIADADTIAESNLHRQFLYNPEDTGSQKAVVLQHKLSAQNPEINIIAYPVSVNESNASELISNYDIVCDCTDDAQARILLDRTCFEHQKPLVYAAVRGWEAYITILNYRKGIRLTDLFSIEALQAEASNNCSSAGIVNTACGTAGSLQANEVIKTICGTEGLLDGRVLCIDLLSSSFRTFALKGPQGLHTNL